MKEAARKQSRMAVNPQREEECWTSSFFLLSFPLSKWKFLYFSLDQKKIQSWSRVEGRGGWFGNCENKYLMCWLFQPRQKMIIILTDSFGCKAGLGQGQEMRCYRFYRGTIKNLVRQCWGLRLYLRIEWSRNQLSSSLLQSIANSICNSFLHRAKI